MLWVTFPLDQILLPHLPFPWSEAVGSNRLYVVFLMAINDLGRGTRGRRRAMRIKFAAGMIRSEFGDVEDRMDGESGGEIEFIGERGDFSFDRKWTNKTSG